MYRGFFSQGKETKLKVVGPVPQTFDEIDSSICQVREANSVDFQAHRVQHLSVTLGRIYTQIMTSMSCSMRKVITQVTVPCRGPRQLRGPNQWLTAPRGIFTLNSSPHQTQGNFLEPVLLSPSLCKLKLMENWLLRQVKLTRSPNTALLTIDYCTKPRTTVPPSAVLLGKREIRLRKFPCTFGEDPKTR